MERFVTRHSDRITATLAGFDRMRFRGTLRSISYRRGFDQFLTRQHVLLKDFGPFALRVSDRLKAHAEALAAAAGRPVEYLASSRVSKEDRARAIAARDGITEGLICVLSCVEPCRSFGVRKDRPTQRLVVTAQERKCLHLYFYYLDREFGLMHLRLQTWLPFTIHVCVNGREWLARQLRAARMTYTQVDNAITAVADPARAQQLLDRLGTRRWTGLLTAWARRINPLPAALDLRPYYWSLDESEFATDVLFRDAAALAGVYPALTRHAIEQFGSDDVLRFLGRRHGPGSDGEVTTHLLRRVEGVRVKHWVEENSIKMYDKHGTVLRIETTINNPRRYMVRRHIVRQGRRCVTWIPMRKGVCDLADAWRCHAPRMPGTSTPSASSVSRAPRIVCSTPSACPSFVRGVAIGRCGPSAPAKRPCSGPSCSARMSPTGFRMPICAACSSPTPTMIRTVGDRPPDGSRGSFASCARIASSIKWRARTAIASARSGTPSSAPRSPSATLISLYWPRPDVAC